MKEQTAQLGHTVIFGSTGASKSAPALLQLLESGHPGGVRSVAQAGITGGEDRTRKAAKQNPVPYYRKFSKRK